MDSLDGGIVGAPDTYDFKERDMLRIAFFPESIAPVNDEVLDEERGVSIPSSNPIDIEAASTSLDEDGVGDSFVDRAR